MNRVAVSILTRRSDVQGKCYNTFFFAQVRYAVYEYARSAVDVLGRRTRIAFLNAHAAEEALPRVLEILRDELKWSPERVKEERKTALDFLHSEMGLKVS